MALLGNFKHYADVTPYVEQTTRISIAWRAHELFQRLQIAAKGKNAALSLLYGCATSIDARWAGDSDYREVEVGAEHFHGPVHLRHALRLAELSEIHGDPFDRMLVAQAVEEDLCVISGDRLLADYPVPLLW